VEANLQWWLVFHATVVIMLLIDLLSNRSNHSNGSRRNIIFSLIWIGIGLAFGAFIYWGFSPEEGFRYLTAYVTEKALSVDNLSSG
jgi:tellurite resistance protein TerC